MLSFKRKRDEYDDSDDEEPAFGRQILPVANLPIDFSGEPMDGAQYLFTVRRDARQLPHVTRVVNPYEQEIPPPPKTDDRVIPKHIALPSEEWRNIFENRFKNFRKNANQPTISVPFTPLNGHRRLLPDKKEREYWWNFLAGKPEPEWNPSKQPKQSAAMRRLSGLTQHETVDTSSTIKWQESWQTNDEGEVELVLRLGPSDPLPTSSDSPGPPKFEDPGPSMVVMETITYKPREALPSLLKSIDERTALHLLMYFTHWINVHLQRPDPSSRPIETHARWIFALLTKVDEVLISPDDMNLLPVAYTVTEPSSAKGWSSVGPQTLSWDRVATDPTTFAVILTSTDGQVSQVLAAEVNGDQKSISVNPPSGGWPQGGGFRINLVKDVNHVNNIYAQSSEYTIGETTTSATGSSSSAVSASASVSSSGRPITTALTPTGVSSSVGTATLPVSSNSARPLTTSSTSATPFPNSSSKNLAADFTPIWKSQVTAWLAEDTPSFDYGGYVVGEAEREAFLFGKGKSAAVLAGSPFFTEVFAQLGCTDICRVEWHLREGETFEPIKHVGTVRGKARLVLLGERVALNLLARCSGIATRSKNIKDLARGYGYTGIVAGTRKTTPGFRLVEKYGMLVGGIDPHRHDLSSMIMLKDNHIWSSGDYFIELGVASADHLPGSITAAVRQARTVGGFSLLLDVEVQSEAEADEAIDAGADIIMLDNIEGDELVGVARNLKAKWKGQRKFLLETSGNITESNLQERASNEIDILSTSFVHQSVPHIDFSLKLQVPGKNA
ncbi:hypothetical protein H0H87_007950 [Tephrocybe sp. NHM501043]|nr:hypothetical protein H0H87_007950 [Tephrocybe sp. NHM501043]